MSCYMLILHWLFLGVLYSCCFHGDLLADSTNLIRVTDFTRSNLCMKLTAFLSLSLRPPGDEGGDTEKSQDSPAKEEETQAEGS